MKDTKRADFSRANQGNNFTHIFWGVIESIDTSASLALKEADLDR